MFVNISVYMRELFQVIKQQERNKSEQILYWTCKAPPFTVNHEGNKFKNKKKKIYRRKKQFNKNKKILKQ